MMEEFLDKEKERLEEIAPVYLSAKMKGVDEQFNKFAMEELIPLCKGAVLELGCGDGLWTEAVLQQVNQVTVVDASELLLENLQHKFAGKVVCRRSFFEEFEPPEKFDTILAAHILEHVQAPLELLKKAAGWLKNDGRLIILVPNAGSLHRRVGQFMGIIGEIDDLSAADKLVGHRRVYTLKTLSDNIIESGLKIIKTGGLTIKPLANAQMEQWPAELLAAYLNMGEDIPEYAGQIYAICCR